MHEQMPNPVSPHEMEDDSLQCGDADQVESPALPCTFSPLSSSSKQVQVLDIPLRPYKEAEERTQQIMRAKTVDLIQDTASKFVHFNPNDIPDFVRDLVGSKKWKSTFGNCSESKIDHEGILLSNLTAEYKSCKDKETNKAIRLQMAKQKQKVLIGQTLR